MKKKLINKKVKSNTNCQSNILFRKLTDKELKEIRGGQNTDGNIITKVEFDDHLFLL